MIIGELWNRLKDYRNTNTIDVICYKGRDEDIDALCEEIDADYPMTFIESLKICNGERVKDCDQSKGIVGVLQVSQILEIYDIFMMNDDWNEWWIPFWSGYECYAILDLDEVSDAFGNVFCVQMHHLKQQYHWADSFEDWLEQSIHEVIANGTLQPETINKLIDPDGLKRKSPSPQQRELSNIYKELSEMEQRKNK